MAADPTTRPMNVGTTAAVIVTADAARTHLIVSNPGTVDVFYGAQGVTTATGHPLRPQGTLVLDGWKTKLYAVAASATTVNVTEGFN